MHYLTNTIVLSHLRSVLLHSFGLFFSSSMKLLGFFLDSVVLQRYSLFLKGFDALTKKK